MTKFDLIFMSVRSLWRRKLRSSLTILGVVIGTTSIVLMISLALAMNQNYENQMNQWGALTLLDVTEADNMDSLLEVDPLDDNALEVFSRLPNVSSVIPYISTTMNVTVNDYSSMREITIIGLDAEELESLGYIAVEGRNYETDEQGIAIVGGTFTNQLVKRGQQVGSKTSSTSNRSSNMFSSIPNISGSTKGSRTNGNSNSGGMPNFGGNMQMPSGGNMMPGDLPNDMSKQEDSTTSDLNLFEDIVKLTYQTFSFRAPNNSIMGGTTQGNTTSVSTPKSTNIEVVGILESGNSDTDNYIIMPREEVLSLIRQKAIYEAKLTGEAPQTTVDTYSKVTIKATSTDAVSTLQTYIESLGYTTSTAQDTLDEMKNMSASIQLILMGIGAISLIVSAIGITNTMMMSISERTKEIGVMKVIGAIISDIKQMFLMEAALIGCLGGVVGLGICYLLSWLLNTYAIGFLGDLVGASSAYETYVSIIPNYLAISSIVFATLVGLIAGYMPAKRATALSALTALKSD